ncbi:MAG: hypothetical protein WAU36_20155 [Cyclobacteriaceae bacterium]
MFDVYSLKARIYPVIILFAPIFVVGFFYTIHFENYLHAASTFGLVGVMSYLFSQLGRDQGKIKEPELWNSWGGQPSIQLLRITDGVINKLSKERYHNKLSQICPLSIAPDYENEKKTPSASDEIYGAWSKFIITQTRDTQKFNLLFKENTSYGFRRNLWALKALSIGVIIILLIVTYLQAYKEVGSFRVSNFSEAYWFTNMSLLIILSFWVFIVTKDWVRVAAFAYASRLCEAIDQL